MEFKPYNKKAFLLPDSIHSMAAYHAKLFEDGKYIFRIHDCLGGIRLTGILEEESDYIEAYQKMTELSSACNEFALHIEKVMRDHYPVIFENLKNPFSICKCKHSPTSLINNIPFCVLCNKRKI